MRLPWRDKPDICPAASGALWAEVSATANIFRMDAGKADFDNVYNGPDARGYYNTLGALGYEIPQHGGDVFAELIRNCFADEHPTLMDVCCSYGASGVLLKTDLRLDAVYEHYEKATAAGLSEGEMLRADTDLIERHRRVDAPTVLGLDIAENAVRYAVASRALDAAFAEDLESGPPSAELAAQMREVDMITTTGGVGYVTEKTFNNLIDATDNTPMVAAFCLRAYDYRPIADSLAERGLVTEKSERVFRQRRFADADEQAWAMKQVEANNHKPDELEADGHYYAQFYLSRPAQLVAERPLAQLLADG